MRHPSIRDRDGTARRLAELFPLHTTAPPLRVAILVQALLLAVGWGFAALALHRRELAFLSSGQSLDPLGTIFADGSSPLTIWPGWAAAALFGLSASRQRGRTPEPPGGRRRAGTLTVSELRAGLRREHTAARWLLALVTLVAVADVARVAVSGLAALVAIGGAGDGLGWMGIEAAGLIAAAVTLAVWVDRFRTEIERLGVLGG